MTENQRLERFSRRKGEDKECLICKKQMYVPLNKTLSGRGKYCSRKCLEISRKGRPIHPNVKAAWEKMPVWNKGTKGIMKPNKTSFKKGSLQGVQFKKGQEPKNKGIRRSTNDLLNNNINAYKALHKRIGRKFKKTGVCEKCNQTKKTQWANKENKYLEVREDWMELCSLCHVNYDQSRL